MADEPEVLKMKHLLFASLPGKHQDVTNVAIDTLFATLFSGWSYVIYLSILSVPPTLRRLSKFKEIEILTISEWIQIIET